MIDARLLDLARHQDDLVAVWQLTGWTADQVSHRTAGLQRVHDGVVRLGGAPLTQRQRWRAATLTTPGSVLSHASAGVCAGFWRREGTVTIITRPGDGGPMTIGTLLVLRSSCLTAHDITFRHGLPCTTVERTLIDLAPGITATQLRKAVREALRLRLTTASLLLGACRRLAGRRGVKRVRTLAERYARLPIDRCKSDAEAYALELLDAARRPIPQVNVLIAGEEADQFFPDPGGGPGRIIEIDGPAFHRLRDDDARKTAIWRAAGITVDRISSGTVFDEPERYLALAPPRRGRTRADRQSPGPGTRGD